MTPEEPLIALVVGPVAAEAWDAPAVRRAAMVGAGPHQDVQVVGEVAEVLRTAAELEAERRPRWVWWSGPREGRALVRSGVRPARAWDVAEAHRLLAGGSEAEPGVAWAHAHGLDPAGVPDAPGDDMFDALTATPDEDPESVTLGPDPANPAGTAHLRADASAGRWQITDQRLISWARAALTCAAAQQALAQRTSPRVVATVHAESAAAVLCEELEVEGLPVDRRTLLSIIEPLCTDPAVRDEAVLRLVPGHEHTDLRNPAQVRELLAGLGLDVPNTRKYVLDLFRDAHPVVPALLEWRTAERIATTYGLRWMETHIGTDDRLRGRWRPSDGAAGRMTAEAGLHNLPAMLRPAVASEDGWALVRADLGQIEPRVLAAVSGDRAFAEASRAEDLYAPVAERLGVERAVAKVAVLAAMYGQRSGAAGQALEGLERAYPVAMRLLEDAYQRGRRGEPIRTWGGRLVRTDSLRWGGVEASADPKLQAARGRFARNAIIQGSAAELFKAWAATVRATTAELGARIVLCLHDELLVHAPAEHAPEVAARMEAALQDAARRWTGGAPVRFVVDMSVVHRWSEAKG